MIDRFSALERRFAQFMRIIASLCFLGIAVVVLFNILSRFAPGLSAQWFEEITELLASWMVFIGAAALWRDKDHFRVAMLDDLLRGRSRQFFHFAAAAISLAFLVILARFGAELVFRTATVSPILQWPRAWWFVSVPIAATIMSLYTAANIVRQITHRNAALSE